MKKLIFLLLSLLPIEASAAVLTVDLRPYSICSQLGCGPSALDARTIRRIWSQADIAIRVRKTRTTQVLDIDVTPRGELDAEDALTQFRLSFAPGDVRPNTIYLGLSTPLDGVFGLAYRNTPSTRLFPFGVVEGMGSARVTAFVAAHELGHVLGAPHVPGGDNLMQPGVPARVFTERNFVPVILDETRLLVRQSPLLAEPATVPSPPSAFLAASALSCLLALASLGMRRSPVPARRAVA